MELGRIDIITEVMVVSLHMLLIREGHLDAVLHVFAFLRQKYNSRMAFNPTYPKIDESMFKEYEWEQFYHGAEEAIPLNAPSPCGEEMVLQGYVNSDHASDKLTQRSRSEYFVFINAVLVQWFLKRESTTKTSVFGAEFITMKLVMESLP